jgi:hypothetical protein
MIRLRACRDTMCRKAALQSGVDRCMMAEFVSIDVMSADDMRRGMRIDTSRPSFSRIAFEMKYDQRLA